MGKLTLLEVSKDLRVVYIRHQDFHTYTDKVNDKQFVRKDMVVMEVFIPEKVYLDYKEEIDNMEVVIEQGYIGEEVTIKPTIKTGTIEKMILEPMYSPYTVKNNKGIVEKLKEITGKDLEQMSRILHRLVVSEVYARGKRLERQLDLKTAVPLDEEPNLGVEDTIEIRYEGELKHKELL